MDHNNAVRNGRSSLQHSATNAHDSWEGDTTIRETPGVCGGYPCVGMTRVSVRVVVNMYRLAGGDIERTHDALDMLTREQIEAALDYYARHPARVDEDIARNERAWAEIRPVLKRGWEEHGQVCRRTEVPAGGCAAKSACADWDIARPEYVTPVGASI